MFGKNSFYHKKVKPFFSSTVVKLCLILVIGLLTRTLYINTIPIGIGNDELDYILNAKAVAIHFSDIGNSWNPLSLQSVPQEQPKGVMPNLLLAPLIAFLPLNLFTAKIFYSLASTGFIVVLYLIVTKLFDKKTALWTSLVAALNPWAVFIGRTTFDIPIAVYFYYLALAVTIIARGKKLLFSIPLFFIAFYSYVGTGLIFFPFVCIVCFFSWYFLHKKTDTKYFLAIIAVCLAIFIFQVYSVTHSALGSRLGELGQPSSPIIQDQVNLERRLSIVTEGNSIFINKYVDFGRYFINKYFVAFSSQLLFTTGETHGLYTTYKHGFFYYTDAILLVIGIYFIIKKNKAIGAFLLALALLAPLPAALSILDNSYIWRASLLFPILIIVVGYGLSQLEQVKGKLKPLFYSILLICYVWQVANFAHIYFLQNPIYNSQQSFFSSRVLARYLKEENALGHEVIVVAQEPRMVFKQFIFYNNLYTWKTAPALAPIFRLEDYHYENISFFPCSVLPGLPESTVVIFHHMIDCDERKHYTSDHVTIPQLADSGAVYSIYNSTLCKKENLHPYLSNLTLNDFDIEGISNDHFCEKFIALEK